MNFDFIVLLATPWSGRIDIMSVTILSFNEPIENSGASMSTSRLRGISGRGSELESRNLRKTIQSRESLEFADIGKFP
jgi:hypothetical protein